MSDLDTSARRHLSPSQFALPGKAKTAGQRAKSGNYPIPDRAHAEAALRLAHLHPGEEAKIDAAVHRKYPDLK